MVLLNKSGLQVNVFGMIDVRKIYIDSVKQIISCKGYDVGLSDEYVFQ